MEERFRMVGSKLDMASQPGQGTSLYFEILRPAGEQHPGG
jgi:hypothetical protein